jgi:hypothetical protein
VFTVNNLNDAGTGSLRDSIDMANSTVGVPDVIAFDASVTGVINLASQLPTITDDLSIAGVGRQIAIDAGGGNYRLFHIDDGDAGNQIAVTLSGLTLSGSVV